MILPVVIAGGVGSRLWPMSRNTLPKQFIRFPQFEESLFQKTVKRVEGIPNVSPPVVICGRAHHSLVVEQLTSKEQPEGIILLEPAGRGTAPASAMAALLAKEKDPDTLLLILPADQVIQDVTSFRQAIEAAIPVASQGYLVTFGVRPESPSTGYGYIKKGESITGSSGFEVLNFIEKPENSVAESYVRDGDFFWNSGIFLLSAQSYLEELENYAPDILNACTRSFENLGRRGNLLEIPELYFSKCRNDSIDYAVMERTSRAAMISLDADWSDLGTWDTFMSLDSGDEDGNSKTGDVYVENVRNSYIQANDRLVAALGVQDLVIVETSDAVLISDKDSVQDVKKIVETLESEGREEATTSLKVEKPWGFYKSLSRGDGHQVKKLVVRPGETLSLQLHKHRAEHWVVTTGKGTVICGEKEMILSKNEHIHIPAGVKHRLANPFSENLEIIEVQVGDYLGEDDIVRLEDKYGRQG